MPYVYIPTFPLSNVLHVYTHPHGHGNREGTIPTSCLSIFPRKYPQGYGNQEGTIPTSCLSIVSHVDIPGIWK